MPRQAFTLIELLVVVAIIVVLLALLTPGLGKALDVASNTRCLTNLRHWTQGMWQYSYDHHKATMYVTEGRNNYWHWRLASYVGQPTYGKTTLVPGDYEVLKVNECPDAEFHGGLGSAKWMWGYDVSQGAYGMNLVSQGAYGMNLWMSSNFRPGTYTDEGSMGFTHYIGTRGNVPFLADSQWVGSWPDHDDVPTPSNTEQPPNDHAKGFFMNRFAIGRHELQHKAINVGFVGGQVESVRLGELWTLRWHRRSVPNYAHQELFD
jgi:prepilin-type N-terminal cleavage/methylation domain-containing protein